MLQRIPQVPFHPALDRVNPDVIELVPQVSVAVEWEGDEQEEVGFGEAYDWSDAGVPFPPPEQEADMQVMAADEVLDKQRVKAESCPQEKIPQEVLMEATEEIGECPICYVEKPLLHLECHHEFCADCLFQQLQLRWPSLRVAFDYLHCAVCRAALAHEELKEPLVDHHKMQERCNGIALRKFREDGYAKQFSDELGHPASSKEEVEQARKLMAIYMCNTCKEPYCGGRVDCVQQQELIAENLCCSECEWAALAGDRRCMVHGHRFAMFKCDSCCNIATYNCTWHHYCERCHGEANQKKYYPCPGPDLCPLGIPHPRNVEADFTDGCREEKAFRSFVLGCTACLGDYEATELQIGRQPDAFGYPDRAWENFNSGKDLLEEVGEAEIRDRLRARVVPRPSGGSALECAERLLLLEQQLTPQQLLEKVGNESITQRLGALDLKRTGTPLDQARRLLLLLDVREEGPAAVHEREEHLARQEANRQAREQRAKWLEKHPAAKAREERSRLAMKYYLKSH